MGGMRKIFYFKGGLNKKNLGTAANDIPKKTSYTLFLILEIHYKFF